MIQTALAGMVLALTSSIEGTPAGTFLTSAMDALKMLITAIGAGLALFGVVNLLEGYGNDNPGAKSQGMKQLVAGIAVMVVANTLVSQLGTLF